MNTFEIDDSIWRLCYINIWITDWLELTSAKRSCKGKFETLDSRPQSETYSDTAK